VIPPFRLGTLDSPWSGAKAHVILALYLAVFDVHRRRPKLKPPPVTSPPRIRTQLTSRITQSSSSRRSAHRRPLHRLREAAEHRRRPIPVPHLTAGDQTLAPAVSYPPLLCDPSDPDPSAHIRSLIESVLIDPGHPDHFKSYGRKARSSRRGINQSESATCQLLVKTKIK
jgi:hypothetical protein